MSFILRVERALEFCNFVLYFPVYIMKYGIVLYFSVCGTRSGIVKILCYIFPHVECALVLWNFVLYFSTCGTRSDIVEFFVIFFCVWNALWYCVIFYCVFNMLSYCGVLRYIFLRVERALVLWSFVLYVSMYGMRSGIVDFCVIFSTFGTGSGIAEFRAIYFCVWNVLWYCGISCYIYLRLERSLVLCNFVLYFSACGTRSIIVESCVIFSVCGTCSGIVEFCVIFYAYGTSSVIV